MTTISQRLAAVLSTRLSGRPARTPGPQPASIDSLYGGQLEALRQVRRGLADVVAARTRVRIRADHASGLVDSLGQEAEQALSEGHEELARRILTRRAAVHEHLTGLTVQHDGLLDQETDILRTLGILQHRLDGIRNRKEALDTSRTAVQARDTAARALSTVGNGLTELDQALLAAERDTAALHAHARGMEELLANQDEIETAFERLALEETVEHELAWLRQKAITEPGPYASRRAPG